MTKLLKKSLALVLTLALCLSAMACCFIVSAEGEEPTRTLTIELDETTANPVAGDTVILNVVGSWTDVAGAEFTVTGLEAYDLTLTPTNTEDDVLYEHADGTVKFVDGNNEPLDDGVLFSISFVAATAGNYTAAIADVVFCDVDENDVAVTYPNADAPFTFTVAEPVVEPEEPEVDAALKFQGASVGFGTSSLQVNFRIRNTVLALYDDMEVVIIPQKYDMTTLNLVENPAEIVIKKADLASAGSTMKSYLYTDIQLYELGLDINYMLRAYDAEDNLVAVSETFTTSAATYLKTSYEASADAKFRTLVADTLIVGDEAVKNTAKNYVGSDLDNAPSIIEGFDTSEATATVDTYNTVDAFNSFNADFGSASSATHQVRKSVSIGKVPYITYRIKDANSALDLSKLSVKVTYGENYDVTFTTATHPEAFSKTGSWINFKFDQVGLQDSDKNIVAVFNYDGKAVCDSTYSVETYLGSAMTGTIADLATALIKLGVSFRAYQAG